MNAPPAPPAPGAIAPTPSGFYDEAAISLNNYSSANSNGRTCVLESARGSVNPTVEDRGSWSMWDIVWTCFVGDEGDECFQVPGREWHVVLRMSVSEPNTQGCVNLRVDAWNGPTPESHGEETSRGVGACIDESNTTKLPPPGTGGLVFVNVPPIESGEPGERTTLFPGLTLMVDHFVANRIIVCPLPEMAVCFMQTRCLYSRRFWTLDPNHWSVQAGAAIGREHCTALPLFMPPRPPDPPPPRSMSDDLAARREARAAKRPRRGTSDA